ncbi:hypothetical protein BKA70DRAFT_373771 [Coprinopsis sp. MPI-PUGE-AT-0042]|nr:hypothetical protein BKA70DRAFT_373771 [Coprinopsis sp. MPI-PUGE-AT-0042]
MPRLNTPGRAHTRVLSLSYNLNPSSTHRCAEPNSEYQARPLVSEISDLSTRIPSNRYNIGQDRRCLWIHRPQRVQWFLAQLRAPMKTNPLPVSIVLLYTTRFSAIDINLPNNLPQGLCHFCRDLRLRHYRRHPRCSPRRPIFPTFSTNAVNASSLRIHGAEGYHMYSDGDAGGYHRPFPAEYGLASLRKPSSEPCHISSCQTHPRIVSLWHRPSLSFLWLITREHSPSTFCSLQPLLCYITHTTRSTLRLASDFLTLSFIRPQPKPGLCLLNDRA